MKYVTWEQTIFLLILSVTTFKIKSSITSLFTEALYYFVMQLKESFGIWVLKKLHKV